MSGMVGELFQNSTKNIYSTSTTVFTFKQNIHPTSTIVFSFKKNAYSTSTIVFTFKKNIHSTSSINNCIYFQEKYLLNFKDRFQFNFKLQNMYSRSQPSNSNLLGGYRSNSTWRKPSKKISM